MQKWVVSVNPNFWTAISRLWGVERQAHRHFSNNSPSLLSFCFRCLTTVWRSSTKVMMRGPIRNGSYSWFSICNHFATKPLFFRIVRIFFDVYKENCEILFLQKNFQADGCAEEKSDTSFKSWIESFNSLFSFIFVSWFRNFFWLEYVKIV